MRSRFLLIFGLTGTLMFASCSPATEEQPIAKSNSTTAANAVNGSVPIEAPNTNTVVIANGAVVAPQPADANTVATASSDQLSPNLPPGVNDKLQQMKRGDGTVDASAIAMKNAKPAPDNSTFTSYLTDAGYEIRTFKNHPQLAKVEKRIGSDGKQTMKIFLRNGKVVQLPGERIAVLSTAPAAAIAEAAGMTETAPIKQPAPGSTGSKKPGN